MIASATLAALLTLNGASGHARYPRPISPIADSAQFQLAVPMRRPELPRDSVLLPMQSLSDPAVLYHADAASSDTADVHPEAHINHTAVGALTGLAVGSTVGFLIGRNKDRKCQEGPCFAAVAFGIEFGLLGAVVGGIIGSQWPSAAQKAGMISFDHTRKQGLRLKISLRR